MSHRRPGLAHLFLALLARLLAWAAPRLGCRQASAEADCKHPGRGPRPTLAWRLSQGLNTAPSL